MASSAGQLTSSLTLGRSDDTGPGASPTMHTHNLTRFLKQNKYNDGSLHGRMSGHTTCNPPLNAYVSTYEARAAVSVAACDAVLGRTNTLTSFAETRPN